MKIFSIIGTRPNFIKIDTELKQTLIHTGQHYDYLMSQAFFKDLKLSKPKYNLGCRGNEIGAMIDKLRILFKKQKPNIVQVYGDTNSSLAGALAAAYENIKVAHIEAGLRSFRMDMPEEINRVLIDKLSTIKFCPNYNASLNLLKEGIKDDVYVVGDPTFDTMTEFLPIPKSKNAEKYIFLTIHRNFNVDSKDTLKRIFDAIKESKEKVIMPIHPRTIKNIKLFHLEVPKNIKVIKPQHYKHSLSLIANAKKVITDSGGIQREAFWFNVPLIILREETEWQEIITKESGILVGTDKEKILIAIKEFHSKMVAPPIYGAKQRIREILYKYL